ncbi:beta-amyrin 11-oxidase-like [Tripterygium wilfordii]|uniref:beta-amyrin 11-oxidase-like n=1 Tax=Tripterygium wilfordii TaxID=458696 RepID=UPI0018F86036|nr:beta-amyrin 11-oxidase-like [Tripterygium wilfordii]
MRRVADIVCNDDQFMFDQSEKGKTDRSFQSKFPFSYGGMGMYKTHLFGRASILVTKPKTCRAVLSNGDESFQIGYPAISKLSPNSLKSIEGVEHKRVRKLMKSPVSGHEALALYIELIEDNVIISLDEWASMSTNQPQIKLLSEIKRVIFKLMINIFLRPNYVSLIGIMDKLFTDVNNAFLSTAINIPGIHHNTLNKADEACQELVKILQGVVEERRIEMERKQSSGVATCMLDLLLKSSEDDDKLEDGEINELLRTMLLAGHETTAYTTMWAISFLHDHPQILQNAKIWG